jgi:hypothetical protein
MDKGMFAFVLGNLLIYSNPILLLHLCLFSLLYLNYQSLNNNGNTSFSGWSKANMCCPVSANSS